MPEIKKFSFDADGDVQTMSTLKGTKWKAESIAGATFEAGRGTLPSGAIGVIDVVMTRAGRGSTETSVFADLDGDGRFVEAFTLDVVNSASFRTENYKFDIVGGAVIKAYELGQCGWRTDRIDADETYGLIRFGKDTFIVRSETGTEGMAFDFYIDRDGDGRWARIAEGQINGDFLHAGEPVDFVGLLDAGLLNPAAVVTV